MHMDRAGKRAETIQYIQTLLNELRILAAGERQQLLAYLIDMAYLEASDTLRKMHGTKEVA
jgi:hypothetical protein